MISLYNIRFDCVFFFFFCSKYEEIYPPDVGEFVFLTDDSYTKAQVLRMEQVFLKILSFNLCTPTPYVFINTYAVLCDMPEKLKALTLVCYTPQFIHNFSNFSVYICIVHL